MIFPHSEARPAGGRAPDEQRGVTIIMLGDPVPYARSAGGKTRVRYTPRRQRNAAATLRILAQEQMTGRGLLEGALSLELVAEFGIPASWSKRRRELACWVTRRPDFDNLAKLASDALNGIVYRDDAQIAWATVVKYYSDTPKVTLTIAQIAAQSSKDPVTIKVSATPRGSLCGGS